MIFAKKINFLNFSENINFKHFIQNILDVKVNIVVNPSVCFERALSKTGNNNLFNSHIEIIDNSKKII